jgi:hypothetical protein
VKFWNIAVCSDHNAETIVDELFVESWKYMRGLVVENWIGNVVFQTNPSLLYETAAMFGVPKHNWSSASPVITHGSRRLSMKPGSMLPTS